MDFSNKLEKYTNKLNSFNGAAAIQPRDYIFKPTGFQKLINFMIDRRDELEVIPMFVEGAHYDYISWGDLTEDNNNITKMFDLIDAYFPGFKQIWKNVIEYIMIEAQEFFTRDYRIDEDDTKGKYEFALGVLTAIYNQISGDLIDSRELCIHRYTPHTNAQCINAMGVVNPSLLHWSSLQCGHDNSAPSKQNQFRGGCGQHVARKCAFLHADQIQYVIPYNNTTFIARVGFNTYPARGYWYNGKPFVNNNNAIPTINNFVPRVPFPPVRV